MQSYEWWNLIRATKRALASITKRILAEVCFASSCKRNWSGYSFVHNKLQKRLNVKKADKLVYIYTNARLLHEEALIDNVAWYKKTFILNSNI